MPPRAYLRNQAAAGILAALRDVDFRRMTISISRSCAVRKFDVPSGECSVAGGEEREYECESEPPQPLRSIREGPRSDQTRAARP